MQIVKVLQTGQNYEIHVHDNAVENFPLWIDYGLRDHDGSHTARIGFNEHFVYGKVRQRVVVWVDEVVYAEFFGADDAEATGDVLSELTTQKGLEEVICRYPDDIIPGRFRMFNVVGLPTRVKGKYVHQAWAVVVNLSDHKTLINYATLHIK